jgi:multidrug efflux system outer membrane protein
MTFSLHSARLTSQPIVRRATLGMTLVCVLTSLCACTVGPDYATPDPQMPEAWVGTRDAASPSKLTSDRAQLAHWWSSLGDSTLDSLIERSLKDNLSLVQAQARIRQARAARTISASAGLPTIDATASATRSRSSGGSTGNLFRAGFDAGWELDLFGGVRREVEAADAQIQSSIEDERDVRISLLAEVATTYVELRSSQSQLDIARRNLATQERSLDLTQRRYTAGFIGRLDVVNAEAQVASTRSRIPTLESSIRQSMYALSTLLALPPAALIDELATSEPLAALPASVPTGLPTELLLRRPDIRRSEADLRAATARIGVATADLYPKFSLSGSIGLQGPQANDLGSLAQRYWSIGPAVQWPLFRGGAIDANIQQQQAAADAAVASYKASILAALQDVESTMTAYESEQRRTSSLDQSVRASTDSLRLSTSLYEAGKTDFLSVLNAQRSLLDAESSRLDSHRLSLTSLIALYKALGGGWDPDTEAAPKGASQN